MMYKVKNDMVPNYISEFFDTQKKGYNLRGNDFNVERYNTTRFGKHSTYGLDSVPDRKKPSTTSFTKSFKTIDCSVLKKAIALLANSVVNDFVMIMILFNCIEQPTFFLFFFLIFRKLPIYT